MSRVSVEVDSGTARSNVAVRAGSTRRAVDTVKASYPGAGVRLVPPDKTSGGRLAALSCYWASRWA
jgi:hypothetical protein